MFINDQNQFFLMNKIISVIYLLGIFLYLFIQRFFIFISDFLYSKKFTLSYFIQNLRKKGEVMFSILKIGGLLLLILIFLFNCSSNTPYEPLDTGGSLSQFSQIQKKVFDVSCATSDCHTGANPAGNLNLSSGVSYNQLVDVTSILVPSKKRVLKNNSAESVLVQILGGEVQPKMPLGATSLSSSTIDSIVKWIDDGAQDN